MQVTSMETSHAIWTAHGNMCFPPNPGPVQTTSSLSNAHKGSQTAATYFKYMRSLVDEHVVVGKAISDKDLISFIIAGLEMDYQSIVSAMDVRTEPLSNDDLVRNMP